MSKNLTGGADSDKLIYAVYPQDDVNQDTYLIRWDAKEGMHFECTSLLQASRDQLRDVIQRARNSQSIASAVWKCDPINLEELLAGNEKK